MARYTTADPFVGERERQYLSDRALDNQMALYSPDAPYNSISTIAPHYGYGNPHTSSGALVRSGGLLEEPVVEHEHHHVHHHIDHGNPAAGALVRPRIGREYSYDDLYDRERRYGSGMSLGSLGHHHYHNRRYGHRHHGIIGGGRFARSDIDLNLDSSFRHRRSSTYDDRELDLAIIDVPAGTRRVTVDMGRDDINWRRDNGVRRSRGLGSELWTEITKDLVTRDAIEDCGYPYEETEFFYYIFEYLHRDQINELVDISYEIRRQRIRDLEYDSIGGVGYSRLGGRLDYDREDTRTEIIIEGARGAGRRHRNRYYH